MSMNYSIKFDPDAKVSYGSWECPECGNKFYWGGKALHLPGCSKKVYEGLIYCYTAEERDGDARLAPPEFKEKLHEQT